MPCLMLPGTWAVDLPWPRDTPDTRDVLKACLERQPPPQYRAEAQTGDLLGAARGSQLCDWRLGSEKQPEKALLPLHIKHPFSATHTGTDTHGPVPQRAGQWNRHRREQEIFSSFPNAKLREYKTHIQFACELTFL